MGPAAVVPIIGSILGGLFGSRPRTTTQRTVRNFQGYDPRLYEFNPDERSSAREAMLGLIGDLFADMPEGGAGFWGQGQFANQFSGGPGASARAQYIDDDEIYGMNAPRPWLEGMMSRGREFVSSQAEDAIRLMRDQAVRSGMSTSSPAYAYMAQMSRQRANEQLANLMRDANLAWTLPAAERRSGRLERNAAMGTEVNMLNARLAEEAARRFAQGQQFAADFGRRGYEDLFQMLNELVEPDGSLQFLDSSSTQTGQGGGGLEGAIGGALGGAMSGMDIYRLINSQDDFGDMGIGGAPSYNVPHQPVGQALIGPAAPAPPPYVPPPTAYVPPPLPLPLPTYTSAPITKMSFFD